MRTLAHSTQPVKCGDAERCGEVAVRTPARHRLLELNPQLARQPLRGTK